MNIDANLTKESLTKVCNTDFPIILGFAITPKKSKNGYLHFIKVENDDVEGAYKKAAKWAQENDGVEISIEFASFSDFATVWKAA